jgi:hypothetical protein
MNMARTSLRSAAVFVAAILMGAASLNARRAPQNSEKPPLRATITIVSQRYCLNSYQDKKDDRFGSLSFLLHLRVENTSDHALILCKDCIYAASEPTLSSINPDGTPGQTRNGGMTFDTFGFDPPRQEPETPDKDYAILKHGESYNGDYKTGILVSYGSPARYRLVSGNYILRTEFTSWRAEEKDSSATLRAKWKSYGYLYSGLLVPDPLTVRVDVPENLPLCR